MRKVPKVFNEVKAYKKLIFNIFSKILTGLLLLISCESKEQYGHIIGDWTIVEVTSRAEPLKLNEVLESNKVSFSDRGTFRQGEAPQLMRGKWKIVGRNLRMIQPETKDLNGRLVSTRHQQEWELTISEKWMIWRGTAMNDTQHLKITLQKN